jgi:molecular chaperone DnaK
MQAVWKLLQLRCALSCVVSCVLQAGILQGEVDSLMVMDQWQASLMRALAQLQLKTSPEARSQVEEKFDMLDDDVEGDADELEMEEEGEEEVDGGGDVGGGSTEGGLSGKRR